MTGPDRGGQIAWLMTALALWRCGARPQRITPGRRFDRTQLDGLVIGGGTDVDPFHYGQDSEPPDDADAERQRSALDWLVGLVLAAFRVLLATRSLQDYDPQRDRLEKTLIEYALREQLPVLGICRGAQLMNVVLGGSLHQKIGHFYTEETRYVRSILPRKTVSILSGTHLYDILGTASGFVNALHKQSIDQLGEDIVVSAREPNGVVQAIEKSDYRFFIGVQWHPEYMPQSAIQKNLFQGLVDAATMRMSGCDGPAVTDGRHTEAG